MSNIDNKNYLQIGYNNLLQASDNLAFSLGENSSNQEGDGTNENGNSSQTQSNNSNSNGSVETKPVKSDGGLDDIWITNFIRSRNWKPRSVGFYLDGQTGYAEMTNVYVSGNIRALTGSIGGFTIGATNLSVTSGGNTTIISSGATAFSAGPTGAPTVTISQAGVLTAVSGAIGGCAIGATSIGSAVFVSGPLGSGWNISSLGTAEFQNVTVRGIIRTSVFEKNTISAVNGMVLVTNSDVLNADMTALDASTLTISGQTTFVVNEVLRIKDGVDDEWLLVTDVSSAPTYGVTRDLATSYSADSNPIWKKGTAVVSMGVGTGTKTGFVLLDSSSANSPFIDIYGRNSNTYSDYTLHARMGWLKGISDSDLGLNNDDIWGIYTDNAYIKGKLAVGTTGYVRGGQTDYDTGTGFFMGYSGAAYKLSIGDPSTFYFNWDGTGISTKMQHSNLHQYDAIVDPDGYGDFTTVSAAITAGNKTIYVRVGTYTESADLSVPAGTIIIGEDWGTTIISFTNYQLILNGDDALLADIQITGYKSSAALVTGSGNGLKIDHCQLIQVATTGNNDILNISGNNFDLINCDIQATNNLVVSGSNANIERNRLSSMDRSGGNDTRFKITISGTDCIFSNNFITITDNNGYLGYGIETTGDRVIISNNKFTNSGTNGQYAIYTSGVDTKIVNNHIVGFDTGIYLNSDYRQVCTGNTITGCASDGINTTSASNVGYGYKVITGNVIYSVGGDGIYTGFSNRTVVENNTIYDATGVGISGNNGNNFRGTIVGNEVSNCGSHGIWYSGGTSSAASRMVICNNNVRDNSGKGIYYKGTSSTIVGNVCIDNADTNLSATDDGGCQIANNVAP